MQDFLEGFELFTRRSTPTVKHPQITIQRRGTFSLNEAAFEALGRPQAVELLYNKARNVIALRGAGTDVKHSYPVRKQPNAHSYLFTGKAFTHFHGIDTDNRAMRYTPQSQGNVLLVDLNEEGMEVFGARAVKGASE